MESTQQLQEFLLT